MSTGGAGPDPAMLAAARSSDVRARMSLAARRDVPRELLFFLAADLAPTVRRLIAQNPQSPLEADLILARDREDAVRDGLVRKTVDRIPANEEADPDPLNALLVEILEILATDASDAIRLALAEAMADLRHAPHSAIRLLAEDGNPSIAAPVLRRSPVLGEEDMVSIARRAASGLHLAALAGRPHLPATVADALAEMREDGAIGTLLMNATAQIREQTLDRLLDRVTEHPDWLGPLAARTDLPRGAADRLAGILADSIADGMALGQFDRDTLARWAAALAGERIEREAEAEPGLNEEQALMALIESGDSEGLAQRLAERSGLSFAAVCEILAAATPRGVVALAWAAGLSMAFAMTLQSQAARVTPALMLLPGEDGGYPLSREELEGQLAFYGATRRPSA